MIKVQVLNEAEQRFETIAEAIGYAQSKVYMSRATERAAYDAYDSGHPFAYCYGFASAVINPASEE